MSGFFILGGKDQEHNQQNQEITTTNNSLFVFKNEEIYNKGFELWQQYYQLHHQQKLQLQDMDLSLMASGSSSSRGRTSNTIVYGTTDDQSVLYRSSSSGFGLMRPSGSNVGTMNCQDCGNQAKKDCIHMRCRTCCKSRGFPCQTHVKSTWVPAAKRRERQQQLHLSSSNLQHHHNQEQQNQQQQQLTLTRGGEYPKRQRENPLTKSGLEVGQHFPAEVSSQALFRCVNVRPMGDEEELYAYQTAVNIGGHVFKGLLYDQGPESRYGESSSGGGGGDQQPHNLVTAATTAPSSNPTNITWLEPSIYPAPLNAFMAGTQFFPPPRP